ncbi:hypothetical protein GCM10027578_41160 [Spirosoma luteolum]
MTEDPYWLPEAYNSAITKLDIGLVMRNELMAPLVQSVIKCWYDRKGKFVDYGGGYGMFTRMMRDRGFDYYRQDIHCANLFAESFDVEDTSTFRADLVTAFEVMEHLIDPVEEVKKMLVYSDTILFSTMVQPTNDVKPETWWYFTPETGQHIALYSRESLRQLARKFDLNYYWNEQNIHLFTRKQIPNNLFKLVTHPRISPVYNFLSGNTGSLLDRDFGFIQTKVTV